MRRNRGRRRGKEITYTHTHTLTIPIFSTIGSLNSILKEKANARTRRIARNTNLRKM